MTDTHSKRSKLSALRERLAEATDEMNWFRVSDFVKLRDFPEVGWGKRVRGGYPRDPQYMILRARLMRLARPQL